MRAPQAHHWQHIKLLKRTIRKQSQGKQPAAPKALEQEDTIEATADPKSALEGAPQAAATAEDNKIDLEWKKHFYG